MHKAVDIIIPTQITDTALLTHCVISVLKTQYKAPVTVWIIVNGSSPNQEKTQRHIAELFAQNAGNYTVQWRTLPTNTGFTGAVNYGVLLGSAPLVVLLNDDTVVTPNWLAELVAAQEKSNAEMVASAIYLATEAFPLPLFSLKKTFVKTQSKQTTHKGVIDSLGFTFLWRGKAIALKEKIVPQHITKKNDYWQNNFDILTSKHTVQKSIVEKNTAKKNNANKQQLLSEPFGPDAAAALYTRKIWQKLHGLNDSFFAYLEDVDFALRARMLGATCVLAEKAVVYHHKHATSSKKGRFKQKQDFKNWWRIVLHTYSGKAWKRFVLLILLERLKNAKGMFF